MYAFSLLHSGQIARKCGEHSLKVLKIGKLLSPANSLLILLQVLKVDEIHKLPIDVDLDSGGIADCKLYSVE